MGKVLAVCTSEKSGTKKKPQGEIVLKESYGIVGDAHASEKWHRQVSLLGIESVQKMEARGLKLNYGDFAENITTEGLDLFHLPIGTRLVTEGGAILEVTQIGKKCHHDCEIFQQVGMCIMPTEGIFCKVIVGGSVKAGDSITVVQ